MFIYEQTRRYHYWRSRTNENITLKALTVWTSTRRLHRASWATRGSRDNVPRCRGPGAPVELGHTTWIQLKHENARTAEHERFSSFARGISELMSRGHFRFWRVSDPPSLKIKMSANVPLSQIVFN